MSCASACVQPGAMTSSQATCVCVRTRSEFFHLSPMIWIRRVQTNLCPTVSHNSSSKRQRIDGQHHNARFSSGQCGVQQPPQLGTVACQARSDGQSQINLGLGTSVKASLHGCADMELHTQRGSQNSATQFFAYW